MSDATRVQEIQDEISAVGKVVADLASKLRHDPVACRYVRPAPIADAANAIYNAAAQLDAIVGRLLRDSRLTS